MPDESSEESLKALRKRASQTGLLLGGVAFVVGSLICLVYLLVYKPWRIR